MIQIPLGTSDREVAARLSLRLTAEFEMTLDRLLRADRLIPEELIAKYFDFCLRRIVLDLSTRSRRTRMSGKITPVDRRHEEITRKVVRDMIQDGLSVDLPPHRIPEYATPDDLEIAMTAQRQQFAFISRSARRPHFKAAASMIVGTSERSSDQDLQLTEAFLHAHATALEIIEKEPKEKATIAAARSAEVLSGLYRSSPSYVEPALSSYTSPPGNNRIQIDPPVLLTDGVSLISNPLTHALLDAQFDAARSSDELLDRSPRTQPFGHDLAGACERSIKRAQAAGKMDDKTADGRRMSIKLFMFVSGLQLVTEVEQHHLSIFVKALKALPRNFNRSLHDRKKSYSQVVAEAKSLPVDKLGRDPGTINRHLETIGAVLSHARVQDKIEVDRDIDTAALRVPETKRARNKRDAFERTEVMQLFEHHIWRGCRSNVRRHEAGDVIVKDGLYWVPLIVHYTGARLEEIAGLPVTAIMPHETDWGFDIRPHEERRLKNLQSERLLPVHEHLLELGLVEHWNSMIAQKDEFLFPELRPKSQKLPFHKAMKYNWDKARRMQLGSKAEGLTMHSLRHYVNITLKDNKAIEKFVRLDILGHAAVDLNEEVYTEGSSFEQKMSAINSIPRAF
ncbi:hypothetical protein [Marivita sp. GX14005]|uniref:hypothetical protein n=1 Tax=Marivita sp. GX14005 TaxID=2942276 RepID=UPI0020191915|nr:hypothetical protein [Marivita sp. GX14005]MCL3882667.1 hypothetical protein [Marivita sp. GX14005]